MIDERRNPENCLVGIGVNAKVEGLDTRIREIEIAMATISSELTNINTSLKKAILERYAFLFVGAGFAYLLQRAFT